MKKLLLLTLLIGCFSFSFANHLKGGFFTYEYLGPGSSNPTNLRYKITLTVYMACNATAQQINDPINFTFFDAGTKVFVRNVSVAITRQYNLGRIKDEECIT